MEQPLAVNAENSRAKVQNVGGDSSGLSWGTPVRAAVRPRSAQLLPARGSRLAAIEQ
jgi:hypothetical protein